MRRPAPLQLVDEAALLAAIDRLDLDPSQAQDIKDRWPKYVLWWNDRATVAKVRVQRLLGIVVVAGALVPARVALRDVKVVNDWWAPGMAVSAIVASLAVAICSGLDRLGGNGDIWREKRNAAEVIKSEGHCFFAQSGDYAGFKTHREANGLSVEKVEKIILSEIAQYGMAIWAKSGVTGVQRSGTSV